MDKGGGSPQKNERMSVCLFCLSLGKKKEKKGKKRLFFVEFTETTFRNLVVSKVVEQRFVRCFKTHAVGEIDYEEIYL